jgi:hypothetical protein
MALGSANPFLPEVLAKYKFEPGFVESFGLSSQIAPTSPFGSTATS